MQLLVAIIAGLLLVALALFDAFETIVLPRRVSRRIRLTRLLYWATWPAYAATARFIHNGARRESFLSFYGPVSLLLLVALWALWLVMGFGVLHWVGGQLAHPPGEATDFGTYVYFSATNFFTLGLGDVQPDPGLGRWLTAFECGTGFAFLALLIGYLPIIYQMFARRETNVALLDQRAGSPPTVSELVRRNVQHADFSHLNLLLREWEIWVGDLLESQLSYPTLAYFRSQHEDQSWVGALAVILDVSAFVLACGGSTAVRQAGFTFAIARHAVGDLTNVLGIAPVSPIVDRLGATSGQRLLAAASSNGLVGDASGEVRERLRAIRSAYEPYLQALAAYLLMDLPPWEPAEDAKDNWETTAWDFDSPVALLGQHSPFRR
jgi:Ion channel